MPYDIEVLAIGEDIDPLLESSSSALNTVQDEFRFHLASVPQRLAARGFRRSTYTTAEVWEFLRDQRVRFGGHRPFIIAFVTRPLQSARFANLFGSHEAIEGLAVVTTFGAGLYVKEEARYCCYYLVRYSLSFVNPNIRVHNDPARTYCYFHQKIHRPDIRTSMDSGVICDQCLEILDNPEIDGRAHRLSDTERDALSKMRQFVKGDLPHAVVMKGGGVKGLAFAGALLELEKYYWFDRHVGASAGAIAAILLAGGYKPEELRDILYRKSFRDFKDAAIWKVPFNLLFRQGCYPGESCRLWIAELLSKKTEKVGEVQMKDLRTALVYASRPGSGTISFDSEGERREAPAAFAARCSMSIPFFFVPMQVDGRRVYDGGLRNNFPLKRFLDDHPTSHCIALYLGNASNRNRRWIGSELLDIFIDGEERQVVDTNRRRVVAIDTSPIGTVDFRMRDYEKEFLLEVGRASALRFLLERNLDNGPNEADVVRAEARAEGLRTFVRRKRVRQRMSRLTFVLLIATIIFGLSRVAF
jgi:predicted acylesterase/phospholipase RssA